MPLIPYKKSKKVGKRRKNKDKSKLCVIASPVADEEVAASEANPNLTLTRTLDACI